MPSDKLQASVMKTLYGFGIGSSTTWGAVWNYKQNKREARRFIMRFRMYH